MVYEFVAVPPLDAKRAVVDGMLSARRNTGNQVIFNVKVQAAAATAPGTGSRNLFHMG